MAQICNEEGALMVLLLNCDFRDDSGTIYDVVAGAFLITGLGEDSFCYLQINIMEGYASEISFTSSKPKVSSILVNNSIT